jgi:hypothetical protein
VRLGLDVTVEDVRTYPTMPPHTCHQSSRILAWLYPELSYVEGQIVLLDDDGRDVVDRDGRPWSMDHAWNETTAGEIVDSTWHLKEVARRYAKRRPS